LCGGAELVQGVHVPVEPGGVVGDLDLDVAGIDFGDTLELLLDLLLDPPRGDRWPDRDQVDHVDDAAHVADHPLDFPALVVMVDLSLEGDDAGLHAGLDPVRGNFHVPFQYMGDRPGDVIVGARQARQPDLQVIGDRLDAVYALGGLGRGELLGITRHMPGQRDRPVLDGYADGVRVGYLGIPLQLTDNVFPDLAVAFHKMPPFAARAES
jgi:hypothetical protein